MSAPRESSGTARSGDRQGQAILLDAHAVEVERGGRRVLRQFELRARAGSVTALVGPNGAGKSSALKALLGLWPSTGSIAICGRALGELSLRERARMVAYVPQQSLLQRGLAVRAVVRQGRYAHDPVWPARRTAEADAVVHAVELTQLRPLWERHWHELSGGEQRRVLIARALATEAPIVLLDEPTASLDVAHTLRLMALLRELAALGRCVVLVLHDLEQVRRCADDAILLDRGETIAAGAAAEVITSEHVRRVYGVELVEHGALGFRLPEPR